MQNMLAGNNSTESLRIFRPYSGEWNSAEETGQVINVKKSFRFFIFEIKEEFFKFLFLNVFIF